MITVLLFRISDSEMNVDNLQTTAVSVSTELAIGLPYRESGEHRLG